jgi:hypothetical protein
MDAPLGPEEEEEQRNAHIFTIVSLVQEILNLLIWMLPWDQRRRSNRGTPTYSPLSTPRQEWGAVVGFLTILSIAMTR